MEDVQDGIKVSIQDGVEEDPVAEEKLIIKGKTGLALAQMITTITNPKIETVIETSTDSLDLTCSIATIIGLAVV